MSRLHPGLAADMDKLQAIPEGGQARAWDATTADPETRRFLSYELGVARLMGVRSE